MIGYKTLRKIGRINKTEREKMSLLGRRNGGTKKAYGKKRDERVEEGKERTGESAGRGGGAGGKGGFNTRSNNLQNTFFSMQCSAEVALNAHKSFKESG